MSDDTFDMRRLSWDMAAGAGGRLMCFWVRESTDFGGVDFDDATNFCEPCGIQAVRLMRRMSPDEFAEREPALDGGWRTDHDSLPYCHTCGAPLDGSLTDYGAKAEIEHFERYPPEIGECQEWHAFSEALETLVHDSPLWARAETILRDAWRRGAMRALMARAERSRAELFAAMEIKC